MKKVAIVTLTIVTLLFSMLPLNSALAKKDGTDIKLEVRNRTGGPMTLLLIDENGNHLYFTYRPGYTNTPLPEGKYSYYASTSCGNQSGVFNVNVTKQLFFSCGDGLETVLRVPDFGAPGLCGNYDWWSQGAKPYEWAPVGWTPAMNPSLPVELRCTDGDPTYVVWGLSLK